MRIFFSSLLFTLTTTVSFYSQAQTNFYWHPTSGTNWNTLANWTTGSFGGTTPTVLPGNTDSVIIGNSTTSYTVILNVSDTVKGLTIQGTGQIFINTSNSSVLYVKGNITSSNTNTIGGGTATIYAMGTANQTIAGNATASGYGKLPNLTINKTGGTLYLTGYITMGGSTTLKYTAGTINAGTSTMIFYYADAVTGNWTFNNVEFQGNGSSFSITNTISVLGNLTFSGSAITTIFGGRINFYGNLVDQNVNLAWNSIAILAKGSNKQTYSFTSGWLPNFAVSKSGDSLKAASGTTAFNVLYFEVDSGTFVAPTGIMSVGGSVFSGSATIFNHAGGNFYHNKGTVKFSIVGNNATFTIATLPSTRFYNVNCAVTCPSGQCNTSYLTPASGDTIKLSGALTHSNNAIIGIWEVKGDLNIGASAVGSVGAIIMDGDSSAMYSYTGTGSTSYLIINKNNSTTPVVPKSGTTNFSVPSLTILSGAFKAPSGTLTIGRGYGVWSGTETIFTHSGGTFDANNGTVTFNPVASAAIFTIATLPTTMFYNMTISAGPCTGCSTPSVVSASNDTIKLLKNFTHNSAYIFGTWEVYGGLNVGSSAVGGAGNIIMTGDSSVTYSYAGTGSNLTGYVTINKGNGATVTPASGTTNLGIAGLYTLSGSFKAPSGTLYIERNYGQYSGTDILFNHVGGAFDANSGTVDFNPIASRATFTIGTLPSTNFYNITMSANPCTGCFIPTVVSGTGDSIKVTNNAVLSRGILSSGPLCVQGNVTVNSGFGSGSAPLFFTGGNNQNFDLTSATNLFDGKIYIKKTAGTVILKSDLVLDATGQSLTFIKGIIKDTSTKQLTIGNGITVSGASDSSFVSGPVKKVGNQSFTFPTGKGSYYNPIAISAPSSTSDAFTGEFFNIANSVTSKDTSLTYISNCEYWQLDRTTGTSNVKVKPYWNSHTCDIYTLSTLRLAYLNSGTWKNAGPATALGNTTNGRDSSNSTLSSFGSFTIGKKSSAVFAHAGADLGICTGSSATIGTSPAVTGGLTPFTYSWSPVTGLSSSTAANPTASPTATTTYILMIADLDHSIARDTMVLTVNPLPSNNAGSNLYICSGSQGVIGAINAAGHTYSWSPVTGLSSSTVSNPTVSLTASTTYTLSETISTTGCSISNNIIVTVNQNPVAHSGNDSAIYTGMNFILGNSPGATGGTSPYAFSWTPATNLSISTISQPTANPTITTTYVLAATDSNGCMGTDTVILTVHPGPLITNAIVPDAGDTIIMISCDTFGTSPGNSGQNVVWDFSSLTNVESDTAYYINPSSTALADSFPLATSASISGDGSFNYFRKNSNDWRFIGNSNILNYTISYPIISFPLSYDVLHNQNDNYISNTDTFYTTAPSYHFTKADAFGTLITPSYTFTNTLRIKTIDSTFAYYEGRTIKSVTHSYVWLNDSSKFFLMVITDNLTTINDIVYNRTKSISYKKL